MTGDGSISPAGAQGRCRTRARGWQGETSQGETGSITLQGWTGENVEKKLFTLPSPKRLGGEFEPKISGGS